MDAVEAETSAGAAAAKAAKAETEAEAVARAEAAWKADPEAPGDEHNATMYKLEVISATSPELAARRLHSYVRGWQFETNGNGPDVWRPLESVRHIVATNPTLDDRSLGLCVSTVLRIVDHAGDVARQRIFASKALEALVVAVIGAYTRPKISLAVVATVQELALALVHVLRLKGGPAFVRGIPRVREFIDIAGEQEKWWADDDDLIPDQWIHEALFCQVLAAPEEASAPKASASKRAREEDGEEAEEPSITEEELRAEVMALGMKAFGRKNFPWQMDPRSLSVRGLVIAKYRLEDRIAAGPTRDPEEMFNFNLPITRMDNHTEEQIAQACKRVRR